MNANLNSEIADRLFETMRHASDETMFKSIDALKRGHLLCVTDRPDGSKVIESFNTNGEKPLNQ